MKQQKRKTYTAKRHLREMKERQMMQNTFEITKLDIHYAPIKSVTYFSDFRF